MGTIEEKLEYLAETKDAIKTALAAKGVEVADTDNFRSYAEKINSISTGGTEINNQDKTITVNGVYQADEGYTGLGTVNINVVDGVQQKFGVNINNILGDIDENGVLQNPANEFSIVFDGVKDICDYGLRNKLQASSNANPGITAVEFPDLETISGKYALSYFGCDNAKIETINFPKLVTITGASALYNAFDGNKASAVINFPELTKIEAESALSYFMGAPSSSSYSRVLNFPKLETIIGNRAFECALYYFKEGSAINLPSLKVIGSPEINTYGELSDISVSITGNSSHELHLPSLETIYCTSNSMSNSTFVYNKFSKIYLPKLNSIITNDENKIDGINNLFYRCINLEEIHFGASNKEYIINHSGYPTLWGRGAGNATVYFDLDS